MSRVPHCIIEMPSFQKTHETCKEMGKYDIHKVVWGAVGVCVCVCVCDIMVQGVCVCDIRVQGVRVCDIRVWVCV